MQLTLTDWLICPYCGPREGLIVLAEQMADRHIVSGALGCPACRRQFPIQDGVADLRVGRAEGETSDAPSSTTPEPLPQETPVARLAAMLGLTEGRGYVLMLGDLAGRAHELASLLPEGFEVIAVSTSVCARVADASVVSALLANAVLPLRDRSVRGAISGAGMPDELQRDALRVLAIGGRWVISTNVTRAEELARLAGLRELARDAHYIVSIRAY